MSAMTTRILVFPEWFNPKDSDQYSQWSHDFCIEIEWRGGDKWVVSNRGRWLSRGGNWKHSGMVERYQYRQYRFSLEEAHDRAEAMIDGLTLMGHTHDEWVAEFARRAATA